MSTSDIPVFAIVGRVNKGKSSIVATLAEDPRVPIAPRPGTTRALTRFPIEVNGEVLFELVDTPGFEDADRALAWLREREAGQGAGAAARPDLVAALVAAHSGEDFAEERLLLKPVLEGAAVLYVVDGGRPYRPNYEAEMEILRWTGRPGMALINRIGEGDHAADWRVALQQYFSVVRDFDAHQASFAQRLRLLRTFGELDDALRGPLERAVEALQAQRARRRTEAARVITDLLVAATTHVVEARAESEEELDRAKLEARFHDDLRAFERAARAGVTELFGHEVEWAGDDPLARPVFAEDLFAEKTFELGLSNAQIVWASTAVGATSGGTIDLMTGVASFGTGALIGGGVGLVTGITAVGRRMARAKVVDSLKDRLTGKGRSWRVGPHANPNFPFVLLDRALLHYRAVIARTHARRDDARLDAGGRVQALDDATRKSLTKAFAALRKQHADPPGEARDAVFHALRPVLDAYDEDR